VNPVHPEILSSRYRCQRHRVHLAGDAAGSW